MARTATTWPKEWSLADLIRHLGNISPTRIRLQPPPGRATEKDLLAIHHREERLYELVDGVLVEKARGYAESFLAMRIGHFLQSYLDRRDLGFLVGPDGAVRLMPGLVRIPDVSFVEWSRVPNREVPTEAIPSLTPTLAIEVLSESNTAAEMERKLKDYFFAGVLLVWLVDPETRTVAVYTSPDDCVTKRGNDVLDGGAVLPGLTLQLPELFARLGPVARPRRKKKR